MRKVSYESSVETLKECSCDSSNCSELHYMSENETKVIDFDDFTNKFFKKYNKNPLPSVDTLCEINGEIFLIEFKNGKIDSKLKKQLTAKIVNSLLLICANENSNYVMKCNFILVYNPEKNILKHGQSFENIRSHIREKGGVEFLPFGLSSYKDIYFKNVYALDEKGFEKFILGKTLSIMH